MRDKRKVIALYCALSGLVGQYRYNWKHASDCFCGANNLSSPGWNFVYEDHIFFKFFRRATFLYLILTKPTLIFKLKKMNAWLDADLKHHLEEK